MRMKIEIIGLILLISLQGCFKADMERGVDNLQNKNESTAVITPYVKPEAFERVEVANSIKVSFAMGNSSRTMTYQKDKTLTLPNGVEINKGEKKITWQYIEKELGFTLEDVVDQKEKSSTMISNANKEGFKSYTIYGGNSIADDLMNYGPQGAFVNLKEYLEFMPNLKKYLNNNPNISKAITAYDGGIYHLPYVAEVNNYARVFLGREDWVTSLLDSTNILENETDTLTVKYNGYWSRNKTNVIKLQNRAARNGVLDRDTALNTLKSYIKETYPEYNRPSQLYIGENAKYDIDELVALWRVVKLSPDTLSKVTTGKVVPDTIITPFFMRKTSNNKELLRLINYFDGEKVHSTDSSSMSGVIYMDNNREIQFSYATASFLSKLDYLKDFYSEGLIYRDFADTSNKIDIRKTLFFSDSKSSQNEFGFMTMDWIASTTGGSTKVDAFLPPVTTISKADITQFIHYVENTRSIKPDGWSISSAASDSEKYAAIMLFDYMFSDKGRAVQNYSVPDIWEAGKFERSSDGKVYPIFKQWFFDTSKELANGSIATFLRDYLGSQLPLGYQKEIGPEVQSQTENGLKALELYTTKNVVTMSYDSPVLYLRLMPPLIALTADDIKDLKSDTSVGTKQEAQIFKYITSDPEALTNSKSIFDLYQSAGIKNYNGIYTRAYNRMMIVN